MEDGPASVVYSGLNEKLSLSCTLAEVRRGSNHVRHYPAQHDRVVRAQTAVCLGQSEYCSSQGFTLLGRLIISHPFETMGQGKIGKEHNVYFLALVMLIAGYDDCR